MAKLVRRYQGGMAAICGGGCRPPPHPPPAIYEGLRPSNSPFQKGWEELVLQLVTGGDNFGMQSNLSCVSHALLGE